jgi:hypothetical protein
MIPSLLATHRQDDISQEGPQLQPELFDLLGFHAQKHIPKDKPMSRIT